MAGRHLRGKTRWTRAGALVAGMLALVAATPGATASSSNNSGGYHPSTGFGGYNWQGKVRQISAQWHVPTIAPTSPAGHASTWVGAQSADGSAPFIQLGTTEDLFSSDSPEYAGFWSDSHVGYHPQFIFNVKAGDLISSDMTRVPSGWQLVFDDETKNRSTTLTIHYGSTGTYNQGEWLQEDPTSGLVSATDLPYPDMSLVTFDHLRVNGTSPSLTLLGGGQAMLASGGTFLVPSAVHDDAFSFSSPTGPAKSYLIAASALDRALSVFEVDQEQWSSLSTSRRTTAARTLRSAYETNAFELAFHPWPDNAKSDIKTLLRDDQQIVKDIATWIRSGLSLKSNAYTTMTIDQGDGDLADQIRAELGLPPS
jgi:hypothetical protein